MAGASVDLDAGSACVLRNALDSSIYLASGLTAVIFDTGASISISNNARPNCKESVQVCV